METLIDGEIRTVSAQVWQWRDAGHEDPEGSTDSRDRWYPTQREDQGDVVERILAPTTEYPRRYYRRCLTRGHCRLLVDRGLLGYDVPPDVTQWMPMLRISILNYLSGHLEPR